MKRIFPQSAVVIIVITGLAAWWFNRTPAHDPHYDAAACVVIDVMHKAPDASEDFAKSIGTVLDNENSDYSISKVKFDASLAKVSVQRYQSLSEEQKSAATQNVDKCIDVMATGPAGKTNG